MSSEKVALVTGGSRGIGKAIAGQLASEGWTVWITARDAGALDSAVREIRTAGGSAFGFAADVRNRGDIDRLFEAVGNSGGSVEVLINNAGVANGGIPFVDEDPDRWWETLEINVRGPMLLIQKALPAMKAGGSGVIINVSSLAAIKSMNYASAYAVSKAALTRMTGSLSYELAGTGVSVYNISPGLVLTDMTKDAPGIKDIPDEYWSRPEDAARLCARLASGKYRSLTGRFIHVTEDLDTLSEAAERIVEEDLYVLRLQGLNGPL